MPADWARSRLPTLAPALANRQRWGWAIAYIIVFVLLDWASFIRPYQGLNITPWSPQPAWAVAFLISGRVGLRTVFAGLLAAELVVRGWPQDWLATLATCGVLSLIYAATARALMLSLKPEHSVVSLPGLLRLIVVSTVASALAAASFVLSMVASQGGRDVVGASLSEAVVRYWVGDGVGLIVSMPMLLMALDPVRRQSLWDAFRQPRWWATAAAVLAVLVFIFGTSNLTAWWTSAHLEAGAKGMSLARGDDHFRYFYLLMLPVMWSAATQGLAGAVLTVTLTQLGMMTMGAAVAHRDLSLFELQVLMAVITMAGLALGVVVDERARAAAELRQSLRLAAAGHLAGALAHELGQPLTAVRSYADAAKVLLQRGQAGQPVTEPLLQVVQRIDQDAQRAAEVLKRLRDFFRTGATQLAPCDPMALMLQAQQGAARRAQALQVTVQAFDTLADAQCWVRGDGGTDVPPQPEIARMLPQVWVDPVQIDVVLRNVLANALDAVSEGPELRSQAAREPQGRIVPAGRPARIAWVLQVSGELADRRLCLHVLDSGPGIAPQRIQAMFEPTTSDKPAGMGIGLSICRAIVQAHDGQLIAHPASFGHLELNLRIQRES